MDEETGTKSDQSFIRPNRPLSAVERIARLTAKFVILWLLTTIICTVVWQAVINERFYDCTDAFGFDYWQPGNWVHNDVVVVDHVVHNRSMSEPDTIKVGWTVARLWHLWYSFIAISFIVSLSLAFVPWLPKGSTPAKKSLPAQTCGV